MEWNLKFERVENMQNTGCFVFIILDVLSFFHNENTFENLFCEKFSIISSK